MSLNEDFAPYQQSIDSTITFLRAILAICVVSVFASLITLSSIWYIPFIVLLIIAMLFHITVWYNVKKFCNEMGIEFAINYSLDDDFNVKIEGGKNGRRI